VNARRGVVMLNPGSQPVHPAPKPPQGRDGEVNLDKPDRPARSRAWPGSGHAIFPAAQRPAVRGPPSLMPTASVPRSAPTPNKVP